MKLHTLNKTKNGRGFKLVVSTIFCFSCFAFVWVWGQTAPALKISVTPTNQVSLTVINGIPTGLYHIYFTPFLGDPDYPWTLLANGTTGQTNFTFSAADYDQIFFKAINNSNFVAPSVTLLIQSPANGSTIH
jgi:hypothetical protein